MRVQVFRFRCPSCLLCISVLPDGMLPYRWLSVERLQASQDQRAGIGSGPDPPPNELEAGALDRAWKRLSLRVSTLKEAFGQLISVALTSTEQAWLQMRRAKGALSQIQAFLALTHRSLLGDYLCLRLPKTRGN